MWIFYSGGMLLPSLAPLDKADPKMTRNGEFALQIRGREVAHLENFIKDYVDPMGLEHSPVENTPSMDYTCRFYMRRGDFAVAVGQAILDIDYRKFKESSERLGPDGKPKYASGRSYHDLLVSIWSTTARWRQPGGFWGGAYSKKGADTRKGHYAQSTFLEDADWASYAPDDRDGALDYTPGSALRKMMLLEEVRDIPASQWASYLGDEELKLIVSEHAAALRNEKKSRKKRFNRKKAS